MTVIAWDGKTIAADRQVTTNDMRSSTTKLRRLPSGEVIASTGDVCLGRTLMDWYEGGADPAAYPKFQNEEWARLIVVGANGLRYFERYPAAVLCEDQYIAFGSGRDFAMGAMAMGADARRAVEVASQFSTGCGLGCDTMQYEKPAARKAAVVRSRQSWTM